MMTTHCAGRFMIRKIPWLLAVSDSGCTALAGASTAVGGMDFTTGWVKFTQNSIPISVSNLGGTCSEC